MLNKFLAFIVIFVVATLVILWKFIPKPSQPLNRVYITVNDVASNSKTVIIEARQDEYLITKNLIISGESASGTLNIVSGKWLINATAYDSKKIKTQNTNSLLSVSTTNMRVLLYFQGFKYEDFLSVTGKNITNLNNNKIVLKGFGLTNAVYNISNPNDLMNSVYKITKQDYERIKNTSANMVRFYVQYDWLQPEYIEGFFNYLDKQIRYARKNNIYIVLNLHFFGMAEDVQKNSADGFYKGDIASNNYDLVDVWRKISTRYQYEPCIAAYDLINEPSCSKTFPENKLYELYSSIIQAIRKNGDDHIIMIADPVQKFNELEANYYSLKTPFKKIADNNIVYEYHFYQPIEFTHQGFFESEFFELGTSYPYLKQQSQYKGGYYGNPYWKNTPNNSWKKYEGHWVNFEKQANCKVSPSSDMFNINLSASKLMGKVWFDDIVLEKKNLKTGKIEKIKVKNADFGLAKDFSGWVTNPSPSNKPSGWYALNDPDSYGIDFSWDKATDHTGNGSGSLAVDGTKAQWGTNNPWGRWAQDGGAGSTFYPIEHGYAYRTSAWIKAEGDSNYNISIAFAINTVKNVKVDKAYLKNFISNFYIKWADSNNVPLYCGEFGLTHPNQLPNNSKLSDKEQIQWLTDVLEILNTSNISWTYHSYKSYSNRGDLFGLFDEKYPDSKFSHIITNGLGTNPIIR